MILTINLDPVEALPKLYDAVDGITRMIMDAKDNVCLLYTSPSPRDCS